jgi:hypothetical protein
MKHIRNLTLILLIFLCSRVAEANPVSGRVLLRGSNAPVAQAIVDFAGSQQARAITIDDGTFYVSNLASGTYTVTITYRGNAKKPISASVPAGNVLTFYIDP